MAPYSGRVKYDQASTTSTPGISNGHSLTLLTTIKIGTASAFHALAARFNDKKVGIVRQNAQQDRADDPIDADHVLVSRRKRVLPERVGDEHFARLSVVAAQEDEMTC